MLTKWYVYVDGESLYIQSEMRLKKLFGQPLDMTGLRSEYGLRINPDCMFFWDQGFIEPHWVEQPSRRYYFSAYSAGGDDKVAALHEYVRAEGFDPQLIREDKSIRDRRRNGLEELALIEKPKGADIMLAVRMIEDAISNNYERCWLFTSDADYLPVIRAVRRLGKTVVVFGFASTIKNPELKYVPDTFVDLELRHFSRNRFGLMPKEQ